MRWAGTHLNADFCPRDLQGRIGLPRQATFAVSASFCLVQRSPRSELVQALEAAAQ